jgi:hypothetical protein
MLNLVFALVPPLALDRRDAEEGFLGKLVLRARRRTRHHRALREPRRLDNRDLDGTEPMISRLALLALLAGSSALPGGARAADTQAVDTYLAVTGTGPAPEGRLAADELAPLDARVVALGGGTAVVYYTYDEEGANVVRVVATVGTGLDGAATPARFVSRSPRARGPRSRSRARPAPGRTCSSSPTTAAS